MSDREDSQDAMDNGQSPDAQRDYGSHSDREGSHDGHHSANGHSPRPSGRSRSGSRSDSRRYRKSRSRSGSRGKGGKYSRRSPNSRRSKRSRSPSRRRHQTNRENPHPGRCLGIFGLSVYTTERDLKEVFNKYGPIEDVQIVYDAQTGRSRGFAFVYFENKNNAAEAKDRCNGIEIDGRRIRVDFSITQRAHTPTPGIYMGKPSHPRYRNKFRGGYGYGDRGGRGGSPYFRRERRGDGGRYGGGGSRSRSRSYSPRPSKRHYR